MPRAMPSLFYISLKGDLGTLARIGDHFGSWR
jgi:hypothetical protein